MNFYQSYNLVLGVGSGSCDGPVLETKVGRPSEGGN